MTPPPPDVIEAFGLNGSPEPMPGGRGLCYIVDQVVFKPSDDDVEAQWISKLVADLHISSQTLYRLAAPISTVSRPGTFLFKGWTASAFMPGSASPRGRFADIFGASRAFHADLAVLVLSKPDEIGRQSNRWTKAESVVWDGVDVDEIEGLHKATLAQFQPLLDKLCQVWRPLPDDIPCQLIHGDLTGNLLFEENMPPVILDHTFYWRPAEYANAIVVADGLAWAGEDRGLVDLYKANDNSIQLLVRAMYWRCLTYAIDTDVEWIRKALPNADYPKAVEVTARTTRHLDEANVASSLTRLISMTAATKLHAESLSHVPWKMLPSTPTLSFTIPSLHDGITLDCRVFHPRSLTISGSSSSSSSRSPGSWRKNVAIVAHPYAPLGGSQDDPVVDLVAGTLLKTGFVVGTFNFRGARGSAGRTSWTAKAERADYASFAGFLFHYAHFLDPFPRDLTHDRPTSPTGPPPSPAAIPTTPTIPQTSKEPPVLLFAGYSYGAMVTSQLPALHPILEPFAGPLTGTPAAEIRLRAQHLAESQNAAIHAAVRAARSRSHASRNSLGVRVGGDEDLLHVRKSHDGGGGRRSFSLEDAEDRIRKGVAELVARTRPKHGHHARSLSWRSRHRHGGSAGDSSSKASSASVEDIPEEAAGEGSEAKDSEHHLPAIPDLYAPRVAYLMVSPPVGMMTNLATMSFSLPFLRSHSHHKDRRAPGHEGHDSDKSLSDPDTDVDPDRKLVRNPSMVIYGDADKFLTAKKMRAWCKQLSEAEKGRSQFRSHEVSTAGHFWTEGKTLYVLRDAVDAFAKELLQGEKQ
ncbi:uncharacterized protein E0L32_002141 [Thyridium curvatum]|uniref:Uncharacterized protein n=1 Tax=Thyridium curvatum TaxID=1093900 RepID=A0A507ARP5_9PEZI|nr:uncharacterized protein E0L32_002141 [Thyridium curvatum]TPX07538.1 hypothetical protein E0L32_002141 [Thyridium curvatum]